MKKLRNELKKKRKKKGKNIDLVSYPASTVGWVA